LPDCIVVYSKILFKRCNFRSSSGRRKIDILIDTKETFRILKGKKNSPDQYKFIKSTVKVNYLELKDDGKEGELIESLHYDCDTEQSITHPIFHCQIDDSLIANYPSSELPLAEPTLGEGLKRFKNVRIPTANMDLLSVMLSIMADHYTEDDFCKVLDNHYRTKWCKNLPFFIHQQFLDGIKHRDNQSLRSHHWYVLGR